MGRRVLRRHICDYSVCLCPIQRTPGLYGLIRDGLKYRRTHAGLLRIVIRDLICSEQASERVISLKNYQNNNFSHGGIQNISTFAYIFSTFAYILDNISQCNLRYTPKWIKPIKTNSCIYTFPAVFADFMSCLVVFYMKLLLYFFTIPLKRGNL